VRTSVTVTNNGKVAGDEVVQLYLSFPDVAGAPIRALRGFRRIHLAPGASETVSFDLSSRDISMVTDAGDIIVPAGKYALSIGGGQPGSGLPTVGGNFSVAGRIRLPE
jgi:beta-glucosidase